MKHRMSITIDEGLRLKIAEIMRNKQFKNKSHLVEYALYQLIGGKYE